MNTLEKALSGRDYIASGRFTAADLFVGAMVGFMLEFKLLDPRPAFTDYVARITDRDAYRRAQEIDGKLIAEMQAQQSQTA
jgi:glutathione S-transferase